MILFTNPHKTTFKQKGNYNHEKQNEQNQKDHQQKYDILKRSSAKRIQSAQRNGILGCCTYFCPD